MVVVLRTTFFRDNSTFNQHLKSFYEDEKLAQEELTLIINVSFSVQPCGIKAKACFPQINLSNLCYFFAFLWKFIDVF